MPHSARPIAPPTNAQESPKLNVQAAMLLFCPAQAAATSTHPPATFWLPIAPISPAVQAHRAAVEYIASWAPRTPQFHSPSPTQGQLRPSTQK